MAEIPNDMLLLHALFAMGRKRLQEIFIESWNLTQNHQWTNTPINGATLLSWDNQLSNDQRQIVATGDVNLMDISLLSSVLLNGANNLGFIQEADRDPIRALRTIRNQVFHTPIAVINYPAMIETLKLTLINLGIEEINLTAVLGEFVTIVIGNEESRQINRKVLIEWITALGPMIETTVEGQLINFHPDYNFGDRVIHIVIRDQNGNIVNIAIEWATWATVSLATTYIGFFLSGFTSTGIASGSIAAGMMSSAAIGNGGMIAAGSIVSICQSAMAGTFVLSPIGITIIGVATAGFLTRGYFLNKRVS